MVLLILTLVTILFQNNISSEVRQLLDQYDFLLVKSLVTYFQESKLSFSLPMNTHIHTRN